MAGIVAAILDIAAAIGIYAYLLNLTTPEKILQSIAAGIYGRNAFYGGTSMAITGFLLHTWIAIFFATAFVLAYKHINKLIPGKWLQGILYGIVVWSVMNFVVLPLSHARVPAFHLTDALLSLTIIVCCVGIPIALITRKMMR